MSLELKQKLNTFNVSRTALEEATCIKYGHIILINRQFPSSQRNKLTLIMNYLPEKFSSQIDSTSIDEIKRTFDKLNKNPKGRTKLLTYLDQKLMSISSEESLDSPLTTNLEKQTGNLLSVRDVNSPGKSSLNEVKLRKISSLHLLHDNNVKQSSKLRNENVKIELHVKMMKLKLRKRDKIVEKHRKRWCRTKIREEQHRMQLIKLKGLNTRLKNYKDRKIKERAEDLKAITATYENHVLDLSKVSLQLREELNANSVKIQDSQNIIKFTQNQKSWKPQTKDGGKYQADIRKVVYYCAHKHVPSNNISDVIRYISQMIFKVKLERLPSSYALKSMISEMRTLSTAQAVEAILKSSFVNIAWDATTVKTKHINEVHVNTDIGHYVLDAVSLPGAKAMDYVSHITCALENAVICYCTLNPGYDPYQTLSEVQAKITSTMSDRAAVNHRVVKELEKYVGHELLELNCNIHPLDSLAIAFRKLTKAFELENKVTSNLPGNESVLIKVIKAISKMKYKVSSGEPKQLKAFLLSKGVHTNLLERYVGNRFHVIFSLCGNIYYLLEVLLEYFTNVCEKPAAKMVLSSLQLGVVQSELRVGGLFGKSISGPWMKCLYKKALLSNLDSAKILNNAHKTLLQVVERPSLLWQEGFTCFDVEECSDDPVARHLRAVPPTGLELELVTQTAKAFQAVMERQLVQYLQGGELYHLPPERVLLGTNAPVDNMVSESVLGYADFLFRRSNVATDAYNAAKIGYTTNKTSDWVENLTDSSIYSVIKKSKSVLESSKSY